MAEELIKFNELETKDPASVLTGSRLWTKGFKNALINGTFDMWWLGEDFPVSQQPITYTAIRWRLESIGSAIGIAKRSFLVGQTDVPGEPESYAAVTVASSAGAGNFAIMAQYIEGVRQHAGRVVTVSFWAKATAPKFLSVELEQIFGTGGQTSGSTSGIGAKRFTLTTAWQRFTMTVLVPALAGKSIGTDRNDALKFNFWFDSGANFAARSASVGQQSGEFHIGEIQFETGAVATDVERRPRQVEVALCQRYMLVVRAADPYSAFTLGYVPNADAVNLFIPLPVTMRAVPSVTFSGRLSVVNAGLFKTVAQVQSVGMTHAAISLTLRVVEGGLSLNSVALLAANNDAATRLVFDAEFR